MKDLKKMPKKERKEVMITVAAEVQTLCEFEPSIKTDGKSEKEIITLLEEAYKELTPDDKLSDKAISTFEFLGLRELKIVEPIEDANVVDDDESGEKPKKDSKKDKDKPKKDSPVKKEGQITMAAFMDLCIEKGGTYKKIAAAIEKELEARGKPQTITKGRINAHLNFRLQQDPKWLKSRKLKQTDDGIE